MNSNDSLIQELQHKQSWTYLRNQKNSWKIQINRESTWETLYRYTLNQVYTNPTNVFLTEGHPAGINKAGIWIGSGAGRFTVVLFRREFCATRLRMQATAIKLLRVMLYMSKFRVVGMWFLYNPLKHDSVWVAICCVYIHICTDRMGISVCKRVRHISNSYATQINCARHMPNIVPKMYYHIHTCKCDLTQFIALWIHHDTIRRSPYEMNAIQCEN